MKNQVQYWIVFIIVCVAAIIAFTVEAFLIVNWQQDFSTLKAVMAIFSAGVLVQATRIFYAVAIKTLFPARPLPTDRLRQYIANRNAMTEQRPSDDAAEFRLKQRLVIETLKFAEERFRENFKGTHFELCVFVDREQPFMFGYYDSDPRDVARSMPARLEDPLYYVRKGYAVVQVLKEGTSQLKILEDTNAKKAGYIYTSESQGKQIRSTALLCLDPISPCALVVTSNKAKAFSDKNSELVEFIKLLGALVKADLFEDGFINRIRNIKPELFTLQKER